MTDKTAEAAAHFKKRASILKAPCRDPDFVMEETRFSMSHKLQAYS